MKINVSWQEIEHLVKEICKDLEKDTWRPSLVLAHSEKDLVIAELISLEIPCPVYRKHAATGEYSTEYCCLLDKVIRQYSGGILVVITHNTLNSKLKGVKYSGRTLALLNTLGTDFDPHYSGKSIPSFNNLEIIFPWESRHG